MNGPPRRWGIRFPPAVLLWLGGLVSQGTALASTGPVADPGRLEAGRRIYEEGVLPDGSPLVAVRPEGFVLEGRPAACVSCHRESGMGLVEGSLQESVLVPPVAGPLLFAPARFSSGALDTEHHWVPTAAWKRALTRSAYDRAGLARALRDGVDPDGQRLAAPMPRYGLDGASLAALDAYLRQLGATPAPGVGPRELHLAMVIAPDAPPGQSQTVLGVLRTWVAGARFLNRQWRLHVWELEGPPESWADQLGRYYREQPVFALLSGSGGVHWQPVHRFCEDNRVACVLPVLEVAPEDPAGRYAVYYSPGVTLEARVLAAHLLAGAQRREAVPTLVQVVSDATGQRAAGVLRERLLAGGWRVAERGYRATDPQSALAGLPEDAVLVLWLRPAELRRLLAATSRDAVPGAVYLSALMAPPAALSLPQGWKAGVTFVSLEDDLGLQGEIARLRMQRWLRNAGIPPGGDPRVAADAYAACYLVSAALGAIESEEVRRPEAPLSREHLLERLELVVNKYSDGSDLVDVDSHVVAYGRMSLAPGQRVAVRGGILLRYASPSSKRMVAVGRRIVP